MKVTFCIAYCYETIIFQYTIVTDRQSGSTAYRLQARPAPTGPGLWLTAMPRPNLPFNGLHLRNPCKLHGSLLIYRPRRDGRLSWPSWLTHNGRLTHEVVTRQPWLVISAILATRVYFLVSVAITVLHTTPVSLGVFLAYN